MKLKFRTWNTFTKSFYPDFVFVSHFGQEYIHDKENLHVYDEFDPINPCIGLKIQVYAGFDDINGKEIFEGDIVEYKVWHREYNRTEDSRDVVEFKNGAFYPRPLQEYDSKFDGINFRIFDLKVIGNIKENPELDPRDV